MKPVLSVFALITVLVAPVFAAEEVSVNYVFDGNVRPDFSNMSRGPLKIGDFTDSRGGNSNLITDGAGGFVADKPLAEIVRDALIQGLTKGNAALVESGENMTLVGSIVSSEAQLIDSNGVESIQLTIRTRVQLQNSGRTIWETVLFGRGTAPAADGIVPAIQGAMDRTIRGLVQDDYFLIEVR
jgi:hypothetical protein